jgi:hypothetical protein
MESQFRLSPFYVDWCLCQGPSATIHYLSHEDVLTFIIDFMVVAHRVALFFVVDMCTIHTHDMNVQCSINVYSLGYKCQKGS